MPLLFVSGLGMLFVFSTHACKFFFGKMKFTIAKKKKKRVPASHFFLSGFPPLSKHLLLCLFHLELAYSLNNLSLTSKLMYSLSFCLLYFPPFCPGKKLQNCNDM